MKIDRNLNLVLGLEREEGTLYVHSMPIGMAVFERYYLVLAKTFSAVYGGNLGPYGGPRVAAMLLKDAAGAAWVGPDGVEQGLMQEVRRLTNVIGLVDGAWKASPLADALKRGDLDETEVSEVENAVVFFTLASVMHARKDLPDVLAAMGTIWGSSTTSLNCTEYAASLKTSTPAATSDQPVAQPGSIEIVV